MVQKAKFTPEVLLSAPRRSAGVPNPSGTFVLYTSSAYDFKTHKKSIELRSLDVKTGESHVLTKDDEISDIKWMDDDLFACLQAEKDGSTSLYVTSLSKALQKVELGVSHYIAGSIEAPAANLKVTRLSDGENFGVVLSAQATSHGVLYSTEKVAKRTHSSGRLYDSLYVRHWDRYETNQKNALWYAKLSLQRGKYELGSLTNALQGTSLESPFPPFGGADSFDIRHDSIIFVAKDSTLNPALNTKCNVYLLLLKSWSQVVLEKPRRVSIPGFEGATTSPVFDHSSKRAAFLAMKQNGYEADRNHIWIIEDTTADSVVPTCISIDNAWDRSPQSISFTADGSALLATAEDVGFGRLFKIPLKGHSKDQMPIGLTDSGYVSDIRPLADGRIFLTASSLIDNSLYAILHHDEAKSRSVAATSPWSHSNSGHGSKYGLNASQVSGIWTPASDVTINKKIHSWVIKPSNFDSSRKYPVAYLIHGGPQGSWADTFSTRWNPVVLAEQGYIVVAPNPTGSTGYGQRFTDAIYKNWGGDPYQDIVNCFEWVGKHVEGADNKNAVALGASYGGYMMNWIQGHDLGRKLKALVCHDGIFSTTGGMLATEELYFPFHDLGGTPWDQPSLKGEDDNSAPSQGHRNFGASTVSEWRKWDPSQHLDKWSTPQLVIHSSRDYRLTISEGLSAFNVLQARGVDSQFLTFPDENHFVLKPENSLVWHKVVLNWMNRYTGLPPYSKQDPNDEVFWGGLRDEQEAIAADMPAQGKPET